MTTIVYWAWTVRENLASVLICRSITTWRYAKEVAKSHMEIGETTKAGRNRNIGDRPVALQNKLARTSQAQLKVVACGRGPYETAEATF